MAKRLSVLLLVIILVITSMPLSFAHDGHGKTRLNVLYLSGSNTTKGNSPDSILAQYIDKYFVDEQDIKVYHKEIRNFSLSDLTAKDYSAIYISATVLNDINAGIVDSALLTKLKAFDYPTVVENALAPTFGLANTSVTLNLTRGANGSVADDARVYRVPGHREFSLDVISNWDFNDDHFTYKTIQMYDDNTYYHGYDRYVTYEAVNGLKSNAIVSTTTDNLGGGTTYPMIYGYEPGQSQLNNHYRVAGTYGSSTYSHYLSLNSVYLIANAVWWVLQEGEAAQTSFTIETYDEVRNETVSSDPVSINSNASYSFSYEDRDHYEFLYWEKVYGNGTVERISDNISFSEIPTNGVTYRARVQRVNTIEVQTFATDSQVVVDSNVFLLREGLSYKLQYQAIDGYDFTRWTVYETSTNKTTVLTNSLQYTVTPTKNSVYRAEVKSNLAIPKQISILEVQPTDSYRLNAATLSDTLGVTVKVTQIPMSVFIAQRDQLNGKYDVLYFGMRSGSYVPLQDSSLKADGHIYSESSYEDYFSNSFDLGEFYAPNDITQLRANEVLAFMDTNQLVLFDNGIFSSSKETLMKTNFENINQSNVKTYSQVSNNTVATLLRTYNDTDYAIKPLLEVMNHPEDFVTSNGNSHYLTDPEDRYMTFNFGLSYVEPDHTYEATLYLDFDGNNLFEAAKNESVKSEVLYSENVSDVTLRYNLPVTYIGFVPWKIEVEDTTTHVKAYEIGYTAFKGASDSDEGIRHIKVLQITPNDGGNYQLKNLPSVLTHMDGLYDLTIDQMTTSAFNANPLELNGLYDMVVLGFADSLSTVMVLNDAAIASIQTFIDSGQSVLTTHDQFWFKLSDMNKDLMKVTKAFRDQFGQNIYAKDFINGNKNANNSTMLPYYVEAYWDWWYGAQSKQYKAVGFTNRTIDRDSYGLPTTHSAKEINEGQITLFPYVLNDVLNVSTTHFQYYQLDLEREDLMVWHNLYGGSYTGLDARNDYYVYSIGNITYSGTGHASPSGYNDENELFVNTMIKASKTANHAPSIEVEDIMDNMVFYKSDSTIPLSFTVSDMDLNDATSKVKIFIDLDQDGIGDVLVYAKDNVQNEMRIPVSISKDSFNDDDMFDIIIIAEDAKGAQEIKTIKNIQNLSTTALKVAESSWSEGNVLIGDSDTLTINLGTTGEGASDFSNVIVSVVINKAAYDAVASSTDVLGWSAPTVVDGKYVFTKTVADISEVLAFSPMFDAGAGNISADIHLNYTNFGEEKSDVIGPKKLEVTQGQFIITATDRFNRSISGAVLEIDAPNDDYTVETVANSNVVFNAEAGTGTYDLTYHLDGYKDVEIVVTYGDGTTETFTRQLGETEITVSIELDSSRNPVDIALKLYQDIITSVAIDDGVGLVVSKEAYEDQTVFKNMGAVDDVVEINFNIDEVTSRIAFEFDDSSLTNALVAGSGNYYFADGTSSFSGTLTDFDDNPIVGATFVHDAITNTVTVSMAADHLLEPGIYKLNVPVHFDKGIMVYTENQPHAIKLTKMVSDVYNDVNEDGVYADDEFFSGIVKEVNSNIAIGYLIFTDNTNLEDDQNGIVGFKTVSTNILEGAGYGDVQLYIKPSKDVSFDNVNVQLVLRYMEDNALIQLQNNENFRIVEIKDVTGLKREDVSLNNIGGDEYNQEILIKSLPKATGNSDPYVITIRIFVEHSKFKFKDYRLVFSLIYGVNVQEAEINQYIQIIKRLKLQ